MKEDTLLFFKKHAVKIAIGVAVIALLVMGYQMGAKKEAMRTAKIFENQAKEVEKVTNILIKEVRAENKALEADNKAKDKVITKAKADKKELLQKRREDAVRMEELEKRLEVAPPETLLGITRRILGTDEVWWNKERQMFEFSLEAFRSVTIKLSDWEDFTLKREPSYKTQIIKDGVIITELEGKIDNFGKEVGNLKLALDKKIGSYNQLQGAFDEFKRAAGKGGGTLEKILWGLAGAGLGALFGN